MSKIEKVLSNSYSNYLYPFLWMHGEDHEAIKEYVDKIYSSNIKALCVEPRPHPDFVGEQWWKDLGVVIKEAKKREMKVWLFDDCQFPTGYANGDIEREHPELRKKYLKTVAVDYIGPQKDAGIIVKWHAGGDRESIMQVGTDSNEADSKAIESGDKIIGVIAAEVADFNSIQTKTLINLSTKLKDGVIHWDIPEGCWRLFTLVETFDGGERATEGYLNPLDPKATQVLIDSVYQPHFEKFKEEFGKTIAGFFTDEPRFGNVKGPNASIGRMEMLLPWRSDMLSLLEDDKKDSVIELLPLLNFDGEGSHEIRYRYMNLISKLYSENFSGKLATWCKEHGVEYIGHLIEDNNSHSRLGYGAGHFFRAIDGQTMSGVDIVLHQLLPGMDMSNYRTFTSTGWDGEFFHYALAKLGSSFGHLDPKKQGRTMCELFGAFGWIEGLNMMKWMADHMLVRGINYFVPHAFSMAPFPDPDCPPHFYAHGKNPQFKYMKYLVNYMNRVSELFNDGQHKASALILYHAEAEWSGEYMLVQKPAKVFTQNQIDFDIISNDLLEKSTVNNKIIQLNGEDFECLVIPYSQRLPLSIIDQINRIVRAGGKVIFLDDYPECITDQSNLKVEEFIDKSRVPVVNIKDLSYYFKENKWQDIDVSNEEKDLRFYHYVHSEMDVYQFFNESVINSVDVEITLHQDGCFYEYDPMLNEISFLAQIKNDSSFDLKLKPQETNFYFITQQKLNDKLLKRTGGFELVKEKMIDEEWEVSTSLSENYPQFTHLMTSRELRNISSIDLLPDFSGTIRYQTEIHLSQTNKVEIELNSVYEIAEVFLDDDSLGVRISTPYVYELEKKLKSGSYRLTIEVTNTLGTEQKDYLSQYKALQPSGLLERPVVRTYK